MSSGKWPTPPIYDPGEGGEKNLQPRPQLSYLEITSFQGTQIDSKIRDDQISPLRNYFSRLWCLKKLLYLFLLHALRVLQIYDTVSGIAPAPSSGGNELGPLAAPFMDKMLDKG